MIGIFSNLISNLITGTMPQNVWEFVKPGLMGAATAALAPFANAAGEFAAGLLPDATPTLLKTLVSQGLSWG